MSDTGGTMNITEIRTIDCPHCTASTPNAAFCSNCGGKLHWWSGTAGLFPKFVRRAAVGTTKHLGEVIIGEIKFWQFYLPSWIISFIGGMLAAYLIGPSALNDPIWSNLRYAGLTTGILGHAVMLPWSHRVRNRTFLFATINAGIVCQVIFRLTVLFTMAWFH